MLETIVPESEQAWLTLRTLDVTSTESSALFGISPYATVFDLFHRKRNRLVVQIEKSERLVWGNRLQDAIANGIAQDEGWDIRRMDEYVRDTDLRMGSSFDFAIGDEGLLEIKNVDAFAFREGWIIDADSLEAPPHIEMQVQHQLGLTGRKFAYIGALIGGNRVVLMKREPDTQIIDKLKVAISNFWAAVAAGVAPSPDFVRDAEVIARLYNHAEPGKILNAQDDAEILALAQEYQQAAAQAKAAEEARDAAKAKLLMRIGDCEKVLGQGFTISAGVVAGGPVAYERKPYRGFRISWRKGQSA